MYVNRTVKKKKKKKNVFENSLFSVIGFCGLPVQFSHSKHCQNFDRVTTLLSTKSNASDHTPRGRDAIRQFCIKGTNFAQTCDIRLNIRLQRKGQRVVKTKANCVETSPISLQRLWLV